MMKEVLSVAAAMLISMGAAGAIILGLSNWLGKVWANRLLVHDELIAAREMEAMIRKRNIYSKLAINMRVFLSRHDMTGSDLRVGFLAAYDEAFLWASDEVVEEIGLFIDLIVQDTSDPESVSNKAKRGEYARCLLAMRRDSGNPRTSAKYRIASF